MLSQDNETLLSGPVGSLSSEEQEKFFAIKAITGNSDIVNNVMVFEKLCFALNSQIPSFEHVEMPNAFQVVGALQELVKYKAIPTNESVKKYIACILFDNGYVIAPSLASFVQPQLDMLTSDHAKELFSGLTVADLLKHTEVEDFTDPIAMQADRHKAIELMLKV